MSQKLLKMSTWEISMYIWPWLCCAATELVQILTCDTWDHDCISLSAEYTAVQICSNNATKKINGTGALQHYTAMAVQQKWLQDIVLVEIYFVDSSLLGYDTVSTGEWLPMFYFSRLKMNKLRLQNSFSQGNGVTAHNPQQNEWESQISENIFINFGTLMHKCNCLWHA
jgi:hypothetical protein